MKAQLFVFFLLFCAFSATAQDVEQAIKEKEVALKQLLIQQKVIEGELEILKLKKVSQDINQWVLPRLEEGEKVIRHSALALVYDEEHEQAKWVAHIIRPEIISGNVSRTNDFREDPLVETGSAEEEDYFVKYLKADSSYGYDGFGFDRGHLAPSADFRWSQQALSESYFYSNMSPQRPEFNREKWAELEGVIRQYVENNPQTEVYVVTGPVLKEGLPKLERSKNGLSIPEKYFKVLLDYDHQKGLGFVMPNKKCLAPVESYALSIDEVEALTGIDFFPALPDLIEESIEKSFDPRAWLPASMQDDVLPLKAESLPAKSYNTVQARLFAGTGQKVKICGTVVSTKLTRSKHTFLNLDKKFPYQIFTVAIWKDYRTNFSYEPQIELMDKKICVEGKVIMSQGTPTMEIQGEKVLDIIEP